jgi:hypothetical protein
MPQSSPLQPLLPVQLQRRYVGALTTFLSCVILEDKIGHDKKKVTAQQTAVAAAVAAAITSIKLKLPVDECTMLVPLLLLLL